MVLRCLEACCRQLEIGQWKGEAAIADLVERWPVVKKKQRQGGAWTHAYLLESKRSQMLLLCLWKGQDLVFENSLVAGNVPKTFCHNSLFLDHAGYKCLQDRAATLEAPSKLTTILWLSLIVDNLIRHCPHSIARDELEGSFESGVAVLSISHITKSKSFTIRRLWLTMWRPRSQAHVVAIWVGCHALTKAIPSNKT